MKNENFGTLLQVLRNAIDASIDLHENVYICSDDQIESSSYFNQSLGRLEVKRLIIDKLLDEYNSTINTTEGDKNVDKIDS
jgi:hypothetical protein